MLFYYYYLIITVLVLVKVVNFGWYAVAFKKLKSKLIGKYRLPINRCIPSSVAFSLSQPTGSVCVENSG